MGKLPLIVLCFVLSFVHSDPLDALWERGSCVNGPTDVVSFTVYLPLREEMMMKDDLDIHAALDDHFPRGADRTPAHEKLAVLRDWFAPANGHVAAVGEWLRPLNCTRLAFSFRCESALVRDVATTLLGSAERPAPLCQYAPAGITTRRRFGKVEPISSIFRLTVDELNAALIAAGMRSHVRHIDGLALHNHTIRATRTRSKVPLGAGVGVGATSFNEYFYWGQNGGPAFLALFRNEQNILSAIVAVVCSDGTIPATIYSCTNALNTISVQVDVVGGPTSLINFPITTVDCGPAQFYVTTSDAFSQYLVCQISLTSLNITGYQTATAFTFLTYADSTTSSVANLCGWFEGAFYGSCSTQSTVRFSNPRLNRIADIRQLYGIPALPPFASSLSTGILEWTDGSETSVFDPSDVGVFMRANGVPYSTAQLNLDNYLFNTTQQETTLDVDLVLGLLPGSTVYLWSIFYDPYLSSPLQQWLAQLDEIITSPASYPQTAWSVSWTFNDPLHNKQQCVEIDNRFRLLTIAGISVVAASGDTGAGMMVGGGPILQFPDASPYCISVGATAIVATPFSEIVCSADRGDIITSGGGYSNFFTKPDYQKGYGGNFGRGAPDISALGAWIEIFLEGTSTPMFGTSAAAPIIAATINLLNAARLQQGKSAIPLMHYFYYNRSLNANFFNDITTGSNCAGESVAFPWTAFWWYGPSNCFSASSGWDPVSGHGSPRFPAMASAAVSWAPRISPPTSIVVNIGGGSGPSQGFIPGLSNGASVGVLILVGIGFTMGATCLYRRHRSLALLRTQQEQFLASGGAHVVFRPGFSDVSANPYPGHVVNNNF